MSTSVRAQYNVQCLYSVHTSKASDELLWTPFDIRLANKYLYSFPYPLVFFSSVHSVVFPVLVCRCGGVGGGDVGVWNNQVKWNFLLFFLSINCLLRLNERNYYAGHHKMKQFDVLYTHKLITMTNKTNFFFFTSYFALLQSQKIMYSQFRFFFFIVVLH